MQKMLRITRILMIAVMLSHCSTPPPAAVMVRPASCATHLQFAEAESLEALIGFADKMRKPVFLHFTVPSMDACRVMEERVFATDQMAAYYNLNFINYRVNVARTGQDLTIADRYGVTRFPTQVFVDGKGKVIYRHEGPATAAQLLEVGHFIHQTASRDLLTLGED